tara:strand:- start:1830 stop:2048 length:219 start_codon:yes stop_codon:yes gene_type:complete
VNVFDSFIDELNKIAAIKAVKGARGRKNKDGLARQAPVVPEPKERARIIRRVKKVGALRRKRNPFRGVEGYG